MSRRAFLINFRTLPEQIMWDDHTPPVTFEEVKERLQLHQLLLEGIYDNLYRMNERVRWLEKRVRKTGLYSNERPRKI